MSSCVSSVSTLSWMALARATSAGSGGRCVAGADVLAGVAGPGVADAGEAAWISIGGTLPLNAMNVPSGDQRGPAIDWIPLFSLSRGQDSWVLTFSTRRIRGKTPATRGLISQ